MNVYLAKILKISLINNYFKTIDANENISIKFYWERLTNDISIKNGYLMQVLSYFSNTNIKLKYLKTYFLTSSVFINIIVMHSICSKIIRPKFLIKYIFFKLFQVKATSIHLKVMFSFFGGWKCHFGAFYLLLNTFIYYETYE